MPARILVALTALATTPPATARLPIPEVLSPREAPREAQRPEDPRRPPPPPPAPATATPPEPSEPAGSVTTESLESRATPPRRGPPTRPFGDRLTVFPYGWVRTDGTYYSAPREGFSNLNLSGARAGGGVEAGPLTAFVTLEVAAAKGPQLFDAFLLWRATPWLSARAGQFKAPFGYRFNLPDLVDELPRGPIAMWAATPGRQVGGEVAYTPWPELEGTFAVFSGIGQNRGANNTKVAFAGKLALRPFASRPRWPALVIVASGFTYSKTNGLTAAIETPLGFEFFRGIPATGRSRRLASGAGFFWRYLSLRGEFFHTLDSRERDTDGDPFTPGEPLAPMIGAGGYVQFAAVLTGQAKDPKTLLPHLAGPRIRDSAVEFSTRYDRFRVGALDRAGNGIQAFSAGLNWIVLTHLRLFVGGHLQRLEAAVPEIPEANSWGITGGITGFFLGRTGFGD